MAKDEKNLVWIDLEMSGLDPERERILEIATLVTNKDLELIAQGPELVIHQPEGILAAMDDWNQQHHGESGLIERVRQSAISTEDAEAETLEFISRHCPERGCPLAGNSIHMDRAFIRRYMPRLDAYLHYRNVDVSTIKELASRWYPEVYEKRPNKRGDHRAMADILESVEELRFYRERLFRDQTPS